MLVHTLSHPFLLFIPFTPRHFLKNFPNFPLNFFISFTSLPLFFFRLASRRTYEGGRTNEGAGSEGRIFFPQGSGSSCSVLFFPFSSFLSLISVPSLSFGSCPSSFHLQVCSSVQLNADIYAISSFFFKPLHSFFHKFYL